MMVKFRRPKEVRLEPMIDILIDDIKLCNFQMKMSGVLDYY